MTTFVEFSDFMSEALYPEAFLRPGQKLIITLYTRRPDLYKKIMDEHAENNCFYTDAKIWSTVQWLKENW